MAPSEKSDTSGSPIGLLRRKGASASDWQIISGRDADDIVKDDGQITAILLRHYDCGRVIRFYGTFAFVEKWARSS